MPVDEPSGEVELRVPATPVGPALARQRIGELLEGAPEIVDDARLLVSELVTNSLLHSGGGGTVKVRVRTAPGSVRLEVCDGGPGFEPGSVGGPRADGGWGLLLVERLSDRWGVRRGPASCVWAEMDLEARVSA